MSGDTKTQYDQAKLLRQISQDPQRGFDSLYETFASTLYGICCRIVRDEESAQDILQDSFVKIWNNLEQFDPERGTLFTWMLQITRRTAIDHLRSKHVKYKPVNGGEMLFERHGGTEEFSPELMDIRDKMQYLDPQLRHVLDLIYIQGYSQEETAKNLNMPLGTLKSKARKAVHSLRELMGETISEN